jgi:hypothetical protein
MMMTSLNQGVDRPRPRKERGVVSDGVCLIGVVMFFRWCVSCWPSRGSTRTPRTASTAPHSRPPSRQVQFPPLGSPPPAPPGCSGRSRPLVDYSTGRPPECGDDAAGVGRESADPGQAGGLRPGQRRREGPPHHRQGNPAVDNYV